MPDRDREQRFPTTVLFTDIADSTRRAAELGDEAWGEILRSHHATVRRELRGHGGHEIDNAGDGFFASFTSPAAAIRCACAIVDSVRPLGIEIRAGVHVGESVRVGDKPGGMAVHIGARIAGHAGPGEVVVSGTVRDLTAGSGISFEDRGLRELKGVEGEWRVYGVVREGPLVPRELAPERPPELGRRRRRGVWAAAGVAAVVAAAVLAIVAFLATRDGAPPRGTPAPSPTASPPRAPTLARVEPDGNLVQLREETRTGQLAMNEGILWVAVARDEVERWDASSDNFVSSVRVGSRSVFRSPGLAVADGLVWVLRFPFDPFTPLPELVAFDAVTHEIRHRVDLGRSAVEVAAGGGAAWVSASDGSIVRVDARTGAVEPAFDLGGAPGPLVWAGDALYGLDLNGRVFRYTPGSGPPRFQPVDEPLALAVGMGSVWVTSAEEGTGGDPDTASLVRLDERTLQQQTVLTVPDRPTAVTATEDSVWVGCLTGWIVGFGDDENRLGEPIPLPERLRGIFLASGPEGVFAAIRLEGL